MCRIYASILALYTSVQMAILITKQCVFIVVVPCNYAVLCIHYTWYVLNLPLYIALLLQCKWLLYFYIFTVVARCNYVFTSYTVTCNDLCLIYCPVPFSANGYSITTLCIFTVVV